MEIARGVIKSAQKIVIYGPEGIGKSTFASMFPNALFIDTEGSTKYMDVARLPKPCSWSMLMDDVRHVYVHPEVCNTLVIDTADWAEKLCSEDLCAKSQKAGIEDFGYGKGYVYLVEDFGKLLNMLEEIVNMGVNVVFTAHAQMRKFEQPDEMGAYDRWEMKLQKKTAPLLKEWADAVLFVNYQTYVVNVDGQGTSKGKNKAQGGRRVMYTSHHPCWDAKNRYNLPPDVDFDYSVIAPYIPVKGSAVPVQYVTTQPVQQQNVLAPVVSDDKSVNEPIQQQLPMESPQQLPPSEHQTTPAVTNEELSDVPKALAALMKEKQVALKEIQEAVAYKGYFPADTPFKAYPNEFVSGVLIAAWPQVFTIIELLRSKEIAPF
jgi:GTPase SAR1 family protein